MTNPAAEHRPARVHVTGGSGFLGRHVIPLLVARGYDVTALARSDHAADVVGALGAVAIPGDLDDPASIDAAFAKSDADVLVNLASLGFGQAPAIVQAAADCGLRRGVFVSSTAIFTTLDVPSKARRTAGEKVVTSSDLDWTVIRPTMIYGTPGDRNLARLLALLPKLPVLPVPGGGTRLQQPVHVDDLAAAIVAAVENPATIRRAYDVAGPEAITFRALLEQAGDAVGRRPRLVPVPLGPTIAAMAVYERLARAPKLKVEQLERLSEDKAFAIDDARRDLGFDPRPFAEGIAQEAALLAHRRTHAANAAGSGATAGAGGTPAIPSATDEHFDEVAASWIRRYADRPSFRHRLAVVGPVVRDAVAATDAGAVLDFGGGPGIFSLVASAGAERVVCLDVNASMVRAGEVHEADAVALLADAGFAARPDRVARVVGPLDADEAAGPFAVVLAIAVLEYLDDPDGTVTELAARLAPGGRLVLTVPDDRSWYRRLEDVVGSAGATLGAVLRSERLRSRAYAATRPHGNAVTWEAGAARGGLLLERSVPLTLGDAGWRRRVHATRIVVLRAPDAAGDPTDDPTDDTTDDATRGTPR